MYILIAIFIVFLIMIGEIQINNRNLLIIFNIISFIYLGSITEKFKIKKFFKEYFENDNMNNDEILSEVNEKNRKKEDELSKDLRKIKGNNNKIPVGYNANIVNLPNAVESPYMDTKINEYGRVDNNYLFNPLDLDNDVNNLDNLNEISHVNFNIPESTNISDKIDEKFGH